MFRGLSEYLDRYRSLVDKHSADISAVLTIINTETSAGLSEKEIKVKNGVISVFAHQMVKGLVYQKKERILKRIHEEGMLHIHDIR